MLDELVQIAPRAVLHGDKDAVAVAEILVKLDNGWTFEHLKESYLSVCCLLILTIHVV